MRCWSSFACFHLTFNLHFISLVLPCSCFLERGRWEMGEWVELGAASAKTLLSAFVLMTCGTMGKWRTAHSPLTVAILSFGGWSGRITGLSDSSLSVGTWSKYLGFSIGANQLYLMQCQPKRHTSGFEVTHLQWHGWSLSTYGSIHFTRRRIY